MREDTIELRDALTALVRGWRWVVAGLLLGVLVALAVNTFMPPRYEARSLVLVRSGSDRSSISIPGLSGGLGGLFPRPSQSALDTEIELITSRTGIEAVVDSLNLMAIVQKPRGTASIEIFADLRLAPNIRGATYRFRREGDAYRVRGPGFEGRVAAGETLGVTGGQIALRDGPLPEEFRVRLIDRDAAVRRVSRALSVGNPGGDVAELVFRAGDRRTAAAVPNVLLSNYMHRRATSDRGVNQRRYEFLLERVDSVQTQLALAEEERRRYQESIGAFDPTLFAEADLQRATMLRAELEALDMEAQALGQLVQANGSGGIPARELAAYPTFLRNQAINDLLSRLLEYEQERLELLERRTEVDPDVLAIAQRIDQLEMQLVSLSTAYLQGIRIQQDQLRRQLSGYEGLLASVPQTAQSAQRLYRDVERLTEMSILLHAQLLEARLDAISEGGDVRQIDPASAPLRPEFPKPWLNLLIGVLGGAFVGTLGAFGRGALATRVETSRDAELAAGVPAVLFRPGAPLLLAESGSYRGVLVAGVGRVDGRAVAEHMAATASLQGREVALVDLVGSGPVPTTNGATGRKAAETSVRVIESGGPTSLVPAPDVSEDYAVYRWPESETLRPGNLRKAIDVLEDRYGLVVTSLPGVDHAYTTALLSRKRPVILVAAAGSVRRAELEEATESLARAGVPTAGVVLKPARGNGKH
jgi:uncharacterized protein involved in exopolysaccharide biosynthesis